MADFIIRIKDKNNTLIQEIVSPVPYLDGAIPGTNLNIECRERGYKVQYVGNYFTKSSQAVDVVVPPVPPIPPVPSPEGLIYDMNVDFDWSNGPSRITMDDPFGDPNKPGTKYIRMNASGDPRILVDRANKVFTLEHDGKYGRAYFGVRNYNVRVNLDFLLPNLDWNLSLKWRNRHQFRQYLREALGYTAEQAKAIPNTQVQGGVGSSYHENTVEQQVEIWHGNNGFSDEKSITPLKANTWYNAEFSMVDVGTGSIREINKLNGVTILDRTVSPPSQFFNKTQFNEWSEGWVRLNTGDAGGQVQFKNLKVYAI